MTTYRTLIIDWAHRSGAQALDPDLIAAERRDVRRRGGWLAGVLRGARPEGVRAGLRWRDVALVVTDPRGRTVVWIEDAGRFLVSNSAETVDAVLPGVGELWRAPAEPARASTRAWPLLQRAHSWAVVSRESGIPRSLSVRLSNDDPSLIRRSVSAWLSGDETFAVELARSAVAMRVVRGDHGYARGAGLHEEQTGSARSL